MISIKESLASNLWRTIHRVTWIGAGLLVFNSLWLRADPAFTLIDTDGNGQQTVLISGASSFDPDGVILDYTWRINNVLVGSGYGPKVQDLSYDFSLGTTTVLLTIRDDAGVSVSTTARVILLPASSSVTIPSPSTSTVPSPAPGIDVLAGHTFTRTTALKKFSFDAPPFQNFSAIAYDDVTQTFFVTESSAAIFEIDANGGLKRTIDVSGMGRAGIPADPEGITWMHGQTFALALHDAKEIAIVDIGNSVTSLSRSQAVIYDVSSGPGKPKGICYLPREDAFYWVAKNAPMAVIKAHISGGQMQTIWTKTVDALPVVDLADVAYFPKLSPYLFLISESSRSIMEVDLTGNSPVVKSSLSLANDDIPQAGGLTFGPDGKMYVVGKHNPGTQIDFSVFTPSPAVGNQPPWVYATVPTEVFGNGTNEALARVDASASFDPEGDPINRYRWTLDNSSTIYDGPNALTTLVLTANGNHVLNLDVFSKDSSGLTQSKRASFNISISLDQSPTGDVPQVNSGLSINYIHPGSGSRHAEFAFNLNSSGSADIHIFDSLGRKIRDISSDSVPAGSYHLNWDLNDDDGHAVASGVYFALIKTPGQTQREKVVVVR